LAMRAANAPSRRASAPAWASWSIGGSKSGEEERATVVVRRCSLGNQNSNLITRASGVRVPSGPTINPRSRCEVSSSKGDIQGGGMMVPMGENSGKTAKRGRGRPFQPGQSGNPGGRPKEDAPVRDLARQHTAEAIRKLATM